MRSEQEIAAFLAGALAGDALAEFEAAAVAEPVLRRSLLEQRCISMGLHALLGRCAELEKGILCAVEAPPAAAAIARVVAQTSGMSAPPRIIPMRAQWARWALSAAAVMVFGALLVSIWRSFQDQRGETVAKAEMPITLERGTKTLDFAYGARVTAFAPARVQALGPAAARLISGHAVVFVPPAARGFSLETAAGVIVDLGTRFEATTQGADSVAVDVIEGRVEVSTRQRERLQLAAGDSAMRHATRGITARFAAREKPPSGETHLANPFVGASFYRNVDYVSAVLASAEREGGELGQKMRQVANYPTFLWLDSIAAVNGTDGYARSLAGHLDQALAQKANAIGLVIYNLPNRDAAALASNGELLVARDGLQRYKTEYIEAIFKTIKQPKYAGLRIVLVIEPDSLPNLIVNQRFPKVAEASKSGAYVQGIQYAVGTLRSLDNTYAYLDVGHAGWLGWPSNFRPFVELVKEVGAGIPGGNGKLDGFISNTANYNVFEEPYLSATQVFGGKPVRSLRGCYDWNDYIYERSFE
jgi:hypothetical protein